MGPTPDDDARPGSGAGLAVTTVVFTRCFKLLSFCNNICCLIGVISKPTKVELCISPVYRQYNTIQYNTKFVKRHVAVASEALAVAKFSKSTM